MGNFKFNRLYQLCFSAGPRYHRKKVFLILMISSLLISGGSSLVYLCYRYAPHPTETGSPIQAIIHKNSSSSTMSAHLPASYLAEVLGLSVDQPTFLNQVHLETAKQHLLETAIIKNAELKLLSPNTLWIEYQTRIPYAYLQDYSNTALDPEGVLFPYAPYYSPRRLPQIYLGDLRPEVAWGSRLPQEIVDLVQNCIALLGEENLVFLDLSQIYAPSAGRREIVISLKENILIRLSSKNYQKQLKYYLLLQRTVLKKGEAHIIDLRIPQVAFFAELNKNKEYPPLKARVSPCDQL